MNNLLSNIYYSIVNNMVIGDAQIDFYNEDANQGNSIWPFVGFMLSLVGLVVAAMGLVKYLSARHKFNIFFDQRDSKEIKDETHKKDMKVGMIMIVVGVILIIASFIVL